MAKTLDNQLFDRLRAGGIRNRVARELAKGGTPAAKTIGDLRKLVDELEDRARGGQRKRRAAAKKAAATRKRRATARSTAAKKAARTRARTTR